ncbi:non-specific lipid transfer protein GPI-anchored 2-like [Durio zibethinus]|uniref:Non-specific lipid transfer protein GPI-anchored 2-like n=1 Tax=Durio zibethinus TaxID=66656 RepID=A0A6P5XUE0_DURZI|nr:non-specific lipid transfer protein GPI-anchored 2-like [Durio zibethinus]
MAAKHTITIVVATIFVLTFCSCMAAQAPAPGPAAVAFGPSAEAPTPDCVSNLYNLSDCLTYVQAGSNLTKPDKPCCPELAGLVESAPQCLCYLLDKNATASYGFNIDMNRALNLPAVCHVSTPPVSLCSVISGALGGPTPSEAPMSAGLAPQGFAASPPSGNSDGALTIAVSGLASLVALAVAFLPTLFGI